MPTQDVGSTDEINETLGQRLCRFNGLYTLLDNDELVASHPRDEITLPACGLHPLDDLSEKRVTDGMA